MPVTDTIDARHRKLEDDGSHLPIDMALLKGRSVELGGETPKSSASKLFRSLSKNLPVDLKDLQSPTKSNQIAVTKARARGPGETSRPIGNSTTSRRASRESYFNRQPTDRSTEDIEYRTQRLVGSSTMNHQPSSVFSQKCMAVGPIIIYVAIFLSAVALGLETEYPNAKVLWKIADHLFTFVFAVEMFFMLWYWKMAYFSSCWNCMDFFLAWFMIIETWIMPLVLVIVLQTTDEYEQFSLFRIVRLVRPMRVIKLLKMKRELCVVVEGIGASLKSMFWISLMLLVTTYACAIFCVSMTEDQDYAAIKFDRDEYFGTVLKSMLTLFSMTILTEWPTVVRPVSQVQPFIVPFFMLFVIFTSFGIMNVIIGVIVERTTAKAQERRAEDLALERKEQSEKITQLWELLGKVDVDGNQQITMEEVDQAEFSDAFDGIMDGINLPHGFTLKDVHTMLDLKGSGVVSNGEFIDGMFRLIYCDTFQHTCLVQLSVGNLGQQIRKAFTHLVAELELMLDEMREELGLSPLGLNPLTPKNDTNKATYSSERSMDSISEYALLASPDCKLTEVGKLGRTASDNPFFLLPQTPTYFSAFPGVGPSPDSPLARRLQMKHQRIMSLNAEKVGKEAKLASRVQQLEERISAQFSTGQATNMVQQLNVQVFGDRLPSETSSKLDSGAQTKNSRDSDVVDQRESRRIGQARISTSTACQTVMHEPMTSKDNLCLACTCGGAQDCNDRQTGFTFFNHERNVPSERRFSVPRAKNLGAPAVMVTVGSSNSESFSEPAAEDPQPAQNRRDSGLAGRIPPPPLTLDLS